MRKSEQIIETIAMRQQHRLASESFLVAVSGIDGSGKGYITAQIVAGLRQRGFRVAGINIDGWLNLPHLRFNKHQPAEHFYQYAIRFDEMFQQFVLPLKRQRSICIEMDFAEETAHAYRKHTYDFQNVEIIVLEGIYLLKSIYRQYYDWALWVDCSFETALERALHRGQEGLPPDETIRAYQSIYFPAQEIHFRVDAPRAAADCILINDPRLEQEGA